MMLQNFYSYDMINRISEKKYESSDNVSNGSIV